MLAPRNNIDCSPVLKRKLVDLPTQPGVYTYYNNRGNILYIGKAKVLRNRIKSYFNSNQLDNKTKRLVENIWDIEFLICKTELEALILENNLIKKHCPPYNILVRDDKSYPYIKFTWNDDYPQAIVTRKVHNDGSSYYGPFFPISTAYRTIELVYRFFHIRNCNIDFSKKRNERACLRYQLKRCTAPCIAAVDQNFYRQQAYEAKMFLEGRRHALKTRLKSAMWKAADNNAFELAANYRDAIHQLDNWLSYQNVANLKQEDIDIYGGAVLDGVVCVHKLMVRNGLMLGRKEYIIKDVESFDGVVLAEILKQVYSEDDIPKQIFVEQEPADRKLLQEWLSSKCGVKPTIHIPRRGCKLELMTMAQSNAYIALERTFALANLNQAVLSELRNQLNIDQVPRHIECFDISHNHGCEVVASCVVFIDGVPDKKKYRRFKISNEQNNDFANMAEVVTRRYQKLKDNSSDLPDLVIIDGGLGQLHAVEVVLTKLDIHTELVSLAKKEELVFKPGNNKPLHIPKNSSALYLLQRIRDEAHRFAINYHRSLKIKKLLESELIQIPGVGSATAEKLLKSYKSVQAVRRASAADLEAKVGLPMAKKIISWQNDGYS